MRKFLYIINMEEEIRGTILFKDDKLVLKYNSGETETFALSHYPSFQVGFNFIRHKGLLYHRK